jgi:hypothetical protein
MGNACFRTIFPMAGNFSGMRRNHGPNAQIDVTGDAMDALGLLALINRAAVPSLRSSVVFQRWIMHSSESSSLSRTAMSRSRYAYCQDATQGQYVLWQV